MVKLRFASATALSIVTIALVLTLPGGIFVHEADAFSRKHAADDVAAPADNQVWITRPDGAQSCTPKSGQTLEDGAADLRRAKVRVLDSRKGNDGKMHMQMCGAPSGTTNAYLIPKEDLPQAVTLGYVPARLIGLAVSGEVWGWGPLQKQLARW